MTDHKSEFWIVVGSKQSNEIVNTIQLAPLGVKVDAQEQARITKMWFVEGYTPKFTVHSFQLTLM